MKNLLFKLTSTETYNYNNNWSQTCLSESSARVNCLADCCIDCSPERLGNGMNWDGDSKHSSATGLTNKPDQL